MTSPHLPSTLYRRDLLLQLLDGWDPGIAGGGVA
jgi:hypothetical protein